MSQSYANWNWNPIPINKGILFKFPSQGGLSVLSKREVIPCNNGHFVIRRWREESEGIPHVFPSKLATLAFNIPPFLRSEQDLARMVANFAHLIEATQLIEEGGPMRLVLGCRSRTDIPKELVIVVGGREYRIALSVREVLVEGGNREQVGGINGGKEDHREEDRRRSENEGIEIGEVQNKERTNESLGKTGEKGSSLSGRREDEIAGSHSPAAKGKKFPFLGDTNLGISKVSENFSSQRSQQGSIGGKRARVEAGTREGVRIESREMEKVQILNQNTEIERGYHLGLLWMMGCGVGLRTLFMLMGYRSLQRKMGQRKRMG